MSKTAALHEITNQALTAVTGGKALKPIKPMAMFCGLNHNNKPRCGSDNYIHALERSGELHNVTPMVLPPKRPTK